MPSLEFRLQTCRFLVELLEFKTALGVLETVVQEDDSQIEAWYLLAFCNFKLKNWKSAKNCCKNVQELGIKFKVHDPDLEQATREIWNSIQPHLGSEEEDDGFETVSEDSSGDEMMVE